MKQQLKDVCLVSGSLKQNPIQVRLRSHSREEDNGTTDLGPEEIENIALLT